MTCKLYKWNWEDCLKADVEKTQSNLIIEDSTGECTKISTKSMRPNCDVTRLQTVQAKPHKKTQEFPQIFHSTNCPYQRKNWTSFIETNPRVRCVHSVRHDLLDHCSTFKCADAFHPAPQCFQLGRLSALICEYPRLS